MFDDYFKNNYFKNMEFTDKNQSVPTFLACW